MTFGVGFILLLLVVGGFAAYQGDRVGMFIGRRRMSLFGLRPRYTSRIVTVFTGVLIVLFTMGSLLLASENVRQALFGMDELRATVTTLSGDVSRKNDELISLEEQRRQLSSDIARLGEENNTLQEQNATWKAENVKLEEENHLLLAEQARLQSTNKTLSESTRYLRDLGGNIYEALQRLRQSDISYHRDETLGSKVIDPAQPAEELRLQLQSLVAETDERVRSEGNSYGVSVERWVPELGRVGTETLIDAAVESIKEYPDVKSIIVQLRSLENTAANEVVIADFELINNVLIYKAGDIIARRVFDGRVAKAELFERFLVDFLYKDVRNAVISKGMLLLGDSGVTYPEAYAVVDAIASQSGAVAVVAYTRKDCWTSGPLELEFTLQPVFGQ